MALPQIETGYKPEFGLGALYQGFNAANADQSAQEEIIKQFLANQQSQVMNPLDVQRKMQEIAADRYKESPEYQTGMRDTISGQGMSNLAAGQTAAGLQPFKQKAGQAELEAQAGEQELTGRLFNNMKKQMDPNVPENERIAAAQEANVLRDELSRTPKTIAQERILGQKLDSNEAIKFAEMDLKERLAQLKAKAISGDKTAQQAIVGYWKQQLSEGKITQEQYVEEISNLQNSITAAKIQPGTTLSPDVAPNVLVPKPPQTTYNPGTASGTTSTASDLQKQVEASGAKWEPSKYDYRVVDGKVQRKAK